VCHGCAVGTRPVILKPYLDCVHGLCITAHKVHPWHAQPREVGGTGFYAAVGVPALAVLGLSANVAVGSVCHPAVHGSLAIFLEAFHSITRMHAAAGTREQGETHIHSRPEGWLSCWLSEGRLSISRLSSWLSVGWLSIGGLSVGGLSSWLSEGRLSISRLASDVNV